MMAPNYQSITISDVDVDDDDDDAPLAMVSGKDETKNPHPEDHLAPPFDSDERPSSLLVGTFNLIATVVGGGVLSLPIVFQKCGIVFATAAMALSACTTYLSLVMLCYSSRRAGGSSYGEVMRSAFGERAEELVAWLLFVFLLFVIVGYMVLIRDIWTPLALLVLPSANEDYVLLGIVVLLLPLLFQRSLHALRYNCFLGFASITVLCWGLCRHGFANLLDDDGRGELEEIDFFKVPTMKDALFSFPIVTCAFLCHFNIVSIQNALSKPTRERTEKLIHYAILACFLLMWSFGLGGYLFAGRNTQGNILLNVPMSRGDDSEEYFLFLLGRIGCGVTIMLASPLMILPCRDSLLEVVDVWFHHSHHSNSNSSPNEEQYCWRVLHRLNNKYEKVEDAFLTTEDEVNEIQPEEMDGETRPRTRSRGNSINSIIVRDEPIQHDYIFRNAVMHYASTLLICSGCYFAAVAVSGVAVVWSFIGSSMAFFIAFILPCSSFILIERAVPNEGRKSQWLQLAWVILIFSILGALICTSNSLGLFGH